jgi:hypothetical protein
MNRLIEIKFDRIENRIDSGDFIDEAQKVQEWGGAGVIISSKLNDDLKKWLSDDDLMREAHQFESEMKKWIPDYKNAEPRRAVITKFPKELSWLFYQLRDVFSYMEDFDLAKYVLFGMLAQSAINYLEVNKEETECTNLLKSVLNEARRVI